LSVKSSARSRSSSERLSHNAMASSARSSAGSFSRSGRGLVDMSDPRMVGLSPQRLRDRALLSNVRPDDQWLARSET
jgi:hypothetical protein